MNHGKEELGAKAVITWARSVVRPLVAVASVAIPLALACTDRDPLQPVKASSTASGARVAVGGKYPRPTKVGFRGDAPVLRWQDEGQCRTVELVPSESGRKYMIKRISMNQIRRRRADTTARLGRVRLVRYSKASGLIERSVNCVVADSPDIEDRVMKLFAAGGPGWKGKAIGSYHLGISSNQAGRMGADSPIDRDLAGETELAIASAEGTSADSEDGSESPLLPEPLGAESFVAPEVAAPRAAPIAHPGLEEVCYFSDFVVYFVCGGNECFWNDGMNQFDCGPGCHVIFLFNNGSRDIFAFDGDCHDVDEGSFDGGEWGDDEEEDADSVAVHVTADSTVIHPGSTVTFTASVYVRGSPATYDGWSYSGTPATGCDANNLTCSMAPATGGWMRFGAHNGYVHIDSSNVDVLIPAIKVTCNDATVRLSVERATNVTCNATLENMPGTLGNIVWGFTGEEAGLSLSSTEIAVVSGTSVSGPVVAPGTLTANASVNGVPVAGSITFAVTARPLGPFSWGPPSGGATLDDCYGVKLGWFGMAGSKTDNTDCVGSMVYPSPDEYLTEGYVTTQSTGSSGPNAGLYYVTGLNVRIWMGYVVAPELTGGPSYDVKPGANGVGSCVSVPTLMTVPVFNSTCKSSIAFFAQRVTSHEACHVSIALSDFQGKVNSGSSNVGRLPSEVEKLVAKGSPASIRDQGRSLVRAADQEMKNTPLQVALEANNHTPVTAWMPSVPAGAWRLWSFEGGSIC